VLPEGSVETVAKKVLVHRLEASGISAFPFRSSGKGQQLAAFIS
jgi:hypothetical protein